MALAGSLEDVPVVDLLQFIHLSGRSGHLVMTGRNGESVVEFVNGNIVFARAPSSRALGQLLMESGLIRVADLERLVARQGALTPRPALGQLLVAEKLAPEEALAACVRRQISEAMLDVASWSDGTFLFEQSRHVPIDDIRVDMQDLLPTVGINTQYFLLEATRLLDERRRLDAGGATPPPPDAQVRELAAIVAPRPAPKPPPVPAPPALPAPATRGGIVMVGFDAAMLRTTRDALHAGGLKVLGHVPSKEASAHLGANGRMPPDGVLLWRWRAERADAQEQLAVMAGLCCQRPKCALVVLASGGMGAMAGAYATGARAVIPIPATTTGLDGGVLAALTRVVTDTARDQQRESQAALGERRAWLQASELTGSIHRAIQHASVSLELMRVAATMLDRAILLLAKKDELVGLGGFGLTSDGQPMAEAMRGIVLPVLAKTPAARALAHGTAIAGPPQELGLGERFFELAGLPATKRGVLIALVSPTRPIGLLYGDNGRLTEPLRGVQAVEFAASQAGLAYENALLRLRLERTVPA